MKDSCSYNLGRMDCSKVDGLKFECGGPDEERCVKTEILIFERLQPHTRVDLKGMNGLRRIQVSNGAAVCDMFESRKILHLTIEGKEDVCNEKSIPTRQTKRSEQTTTGEIMSDRVSGGAKTETTSTNKPSIVIKEAFHLNTYIIIGLDGAGKTTLLYKLKLGEVVTHIPTIGFNVEQLQYKNLSFTAWDIGARDKMRPLFRHYYKGTDAVVIVIDSSDRERLEELYCDVLKPALSADELTNSVFLFLANKRDLPDIMDLDELVQRLNLKHIKHVWNLIETSAILGDGLTECMEWLATQLGNNQSRRSTPQPITTQTDRVRTSGDKQGDKLQHRDYCGRAYSAFKCFFIRPNGPPDVQD